MKQNKKVYIIMCEGRVSQEGYASIDAAINWLRYERLCSINGWTGYDGKYTYTIHEVQIKED